MDPKVCIVILNWNQYLDTKECLESLQKSDYRNFTIFLADNGSKDGSIEKLEKEFPQVSFIGNKENLGFAEGNNAGIRAALNAKPDYLLLLNNDTVVEPDFLSKLVQPVSGDRDIGIASPMIMFYQDKKKVWFMGGGYLPIIKKPFHQYYGQTGPNLSRPFAETKWVSGCAMLIKREVFEKIGILDPDYFNNYEDVDFCVRAKKAGFKIAVVPAAKIYHKFAASMGGKFSPVYTYFRTRNNLLFFKKTGQWAPLVLNLLIFPIYSCFQSLKRRNIQSLKATLLAVLDFLAGRYGKGSLL